MNTVGRKRKLDELDGWKLYIVKRNGYNDYFLLTSYLGYKDFEDHPQLCVRGEETQVSYKYPQAIPSNVKELVRKRLVSRYNRGLDWRIVNRM